MISNTHLVIMIVIMAVITFLLRFLPFIIFSENNTPKVITYLSNALPYAIIGMLVVYALRNTDIIHAASHGLPEAIAVALTAILHIWKGNTLLSVLCGTVCYMLLIQFVFV